MIRALFEQVAVPSKLEPLDLVEVLDWTEAALNRVDRDAFFAKFEEGQAVQYFYEPFLEAFDPELRKQLGVWYTPREIVEYMVGRVDRVLREELHIEDGLADPSVYVLDPATGTGSYPLAVLNCISETLERKGEGGLRAYKLKVAAMQRIFGFEILPAPFVVAHLQLGLLLQRLGAPLSNTKNERAGVYLTNSLTGWEPPTGPRQQLAFRDLAEERDAAEKVKRDTPILVILGNPPYNAFAGVSPAEEHGLVDCYKEGLVSTWGIKKFNLDDLYVRFFRLAERRIVEQTGKGVICYISNFSYLGDPSYVVMRQRFVSEFNKLWFDSLNGDSRETGKQTPDGKPDPSVFSTEYNSAGIRIGTAVGLMVATGETGGAKAVRFRDFWGTTKRADLLASLSVESIDDHYQTVVPTSGNRYSFRPASVSMEYLQWPKIVELCGESPVSGLQEMRHGALMDIDRESLIARMRIYFDPSVTWSEVEALNTGLTQDGPNFNAARVRGKALATEQFSSANVVRYALYPFDDRWCYYTTIPTLWNRTRPTLTAQCWAGNRFLITRMMAERPKEGIAVAMSSALPDYHLLRPNAIAIPLRIRSGEVNAAHGILQKSLFQVGDMAVRANLSKQARDYLRSMGIDNPDANVDTAELLWMHVLAIGCSRAYLAEHGEAIRSDWPRIPLPSSQDVLQKSGSLGREVAALLDTERSSKGITEGTIRAELKSIGRIGRVDDRSINPDSGDLDVTVGWGHGGQGVIMPGSGKIVERAYTPAESAAIEDGAVALGISPATALSLLGGSTFDIYLNQFVRWQNIPANVWRYVIGGYQVLKKWLSYREQTVLGRPLTVDEVQEFTNIARRMAALLLLEPTLDENYRKAQGATFRWSANAPANESSTVQPAE